jgi:hypothetical protein
MTIGILNWQGLQQVFLANKYLQDSGNVDCKFLSLAVIATQGNTPAGGG